MKKIVVVVWEFVKQLYVFVILLASDPFDIAERWFSFDYKPPSYIFWVLFGFAFSISVILTLWNVTRKSKASYQQHKLSIEIQHVLKSIHKRTLKLTDQVYNQFIYLFSQKDYLKFCHNLAATQRKQRVMLEELKKKVKGKKLSRRPEKQRQQVDDLFEQLLPAFDEKSNLPSIVAFGNLINDVPKIQFPQYEGLSDLRDKDYTWNKLSEILEILKQKFPDIINNNQVNEKILEYIDTDFAGCSILLSTRILKQYVPMAITPSEYIKGGVGNPKRKIEKRLTDISLEIQNMIKAITDLGNTQPNS